MNSSGSEQDNPSERSRGQRRDSQGHSAVNISELSDLTGDTPPSEHSSASEEGECGSEIYDASPCPLHRVETAPTPPFPVLKAKPEPATHPRPNVSIPAHCHMHWCTLHHGPGSQSKDSEESISAFHASSGLSDVTVETSATEKVQISPRNEHAINNDILSHCSTASVSRSEKPGRFKDIPETTPPPLKGPVIVATFGSRDEVLWSAEDIIPGFPGPGPMSPGDGYLAIDTGERHERVPGVVGPTSSPFSTESSCLINVWCRSIASRTAHVMTRRCGRGGNGSKSWHQTMQGRFLRSKNVSQS